MGYVQQTEALESEPVSSIQNPTFVVFSLGLPRPCRQIERRCSCSVAPSQGMLRCITFHDDSMQLRIPSPAGTTKVVPPRNFGGRISNDEAPAAPVLLRGSRMLPPNLGKPGVPVAFHPWRVCRDPLLNRIFRHRYVERTDTLEWLLGEPDFRQKEGSTARGCLDCDCRTGRSRHTARGA